MKIEKNFAKNAELSDIAVQRGRAATKIFLQKKTKETKTGWEDFFLTRRRRKHQGAKDFRQDERDE